jgi:tRNA-specific 2-thiouridylase
MKQRVLLGMSGGIDSTVAVCKLKEQNYEVVGITFVFSHVLKRNKDVSDAKKLASVLSIEHYVIDLHKEFEKKVIHYFINEYMNGRTPFPCAYCNPKIKFYYLNEFANKLKCEFIATGHYAKIVSYKEKKVIASGIDSDKDQSFFLWGLTQNIIKRLIFPLGDLYKKEIKNIAKENGFFKLTSKKESVGVCFIEGNNYRNFFESRGIRSKRGNFVNIKGEILGEHTGIINYTIGQRRGLGVISKNPLFVAEFRLEENKIVLAEYANLYKNKLLVNNYQFVDIEKVNTENTYHVKVRYRLQETPCKIHILNEHVAEVSLLKSEAMIANGQTAVFYDEDKVIGGGFILSSE